MKNGMIVAVAVLLMVGCSPRTIVDMYTTEYAPTSADSVKVFAQGEQVPPHSLAIGEMRVSAPALFYEDIMRAAVKKTARNGGNALVVTEHRFPDFWSNIHRVKCTLLRIPQNVADSMARTSMIPLTQQQEQNWESVTSAQYQQELRNAEQRRASQPRNILRASIGPSLMTSDFQIHNHLYKSRCGLDLSLDYDHVWKSGIGFGINYRHDYTTFEEDLVMRTNYIGPSLVLAYPGNGIRYDMAIGFGYCWYSEHFRGLSMSEGHIAPLIRMGLEFSISKNVAYGIQMNTFSVRLDKPEGLEMKKNESYGIQRMGLQMGVRVYL